MKMISNPVSYGFLNLNKPAGWSSRDVVNHIQRLVRPEKVGHAGTLDPLASGVLVVAIGPATRLIQFVHELPKSYQATFQFGCESASDDVETDVTVVPIPDTVTVAEIERCLASFRGPIVQRPPMYSAVKVDGRRAYRLARKGIERELPERTVLIHEAMVISWDTPFLRIELTCGTGTYIRSIGRDLAKRLGTSAIMTALTRTAVGPFLIHDSVGPDAITSDTLPTLLHAPLAALRHLAQRALSESEATDLSHGRPIPARGSESFEPLARITAAVGDQDRLVAILELRTDDRYWPICVLSPATSS